MSMSHKEPIQLEPVEQAKQRFKNALMPRIQAYKARLNKNFFSRCYEYLTTNYGQAGYLRTEAFLSAIDEEKIDSTEKLIRLTTTYNDGHKLPMLLRSTVLEICQFELKHILYIRDWLQCELVNRYAINRHAAMESTTIPEKTINHLYHIVISSNDYGKSYLDRFNTILAQHPIIPSALANYRRDCGICHTEYNEKSGLTYLRNQLFPTLAISQQHDDLPSSDNDVELSSFSNSAAKMKS